MTITQTITALPTPPDPDTDSSSDFEDKAEAFTLAMVTMGTELNTLASQINAAMATLATQLVGGISIPYTFSTTTTDSDPGSGGLRLDNATQNTATTIRADLVGSDGTTVTSIIDLFDDSTSTVKGHLMLRDKDDATKWLLFSVSSLASPSGYKNITVAIVASSAASPFSNGATVLMSFVRTGDKGDTGATGAAGSSGALIRLAALTPTAAANVDFLSTFTSSYDNYLIIGEGLLPASNDTLRFRLANAGSADTGANYSSGNASATGASGGASSIASLSNGAVLAAGKGLNFAMIVTNANDATRLKGLEWRAIHADAATPTFAWQLGVGAYYAANAVSGGRLYWSGGANFSAVGKVYVYGFSNT